MLYLIVRERDATMRKHHYAADHYNLVKGKVIMAYIHMAQIAHLSQDLIEHVTNANNLMMRNKHELDRIAQITKMLCTVHEELERDLGYAQNFK